MVAKTTHVVTLHILSVAAARFFSDYFVSFGDSHDVFVPSFVALIKAHYYFAPVVLRSACLCACLSARILKNKLPNFNKFSAHVVCGRGSLLL